MWYFICVLCACILSYGIAMCGKNIGIGLIELARALRKEKK